MVRRLHMPKQRNGYLSAGGDLLTVGAGGHRLHRRTNRAETSGRTRHMDHQSAAQAGAGLPLRRVTHTRQRSVMLWRTLAFWFGLLVCALAGDALAAEVDLGEGPVLLIADRVQVDTEAKVVTAEGNVEVVRGEHRLLADRLRYDQETDQLEAEGNVVLLEPTGETVFAERVTLSGDLKDGVIEQLGARLPGEGLLAAARARRISGTQNVLDRAVYSPCPLCPDSTGPPLWQIKAREVVHDQVEKTITYKNAFFELYGVPIFYTPYFTQPDPTVKRKTGFLAPTLGNNSELGLMLGTPYYIDLAPNYDLTLTPIFLTKENPVLSAEYRHLLPAGKFELSGSGTYATAPGSDRDVIRDDKAFRGHVEGEGRFRMSETWRSGFDLFVASDDTYLQRYDFSNKNVLINRLYAERFWGRNYGIIQGYGFQGLRKQDDQGRIPVALPWGKIELISDPWKWGSRFTFDGSILALTRTDGLDTRRLSAAGAWRLPWQGPIGDRYEVRLGMRGDLYQTDGDPLTFGDDGQNVETRLSPEARLEWSWPLIADGWGFTPLIEPVASATFMLPDLNSDRIPNEDSRAIEIDDSNLFASDVSPGLDQIVDGSKVSYGLRFGAFGEAGELLSGLVGQSYRINGDLDLSPTTGLDGDFSDFVGRIDVTPHDWFKVRYRFRLDRDSLALLRNEISAGLGPTWMRLGVNYVSLEDDPALDVSRRREEIVGALSLDLTPSITFRTQLRRDLEEDRWISQKFGLVYRNPCLQLVAGVERKFTSNRDAVDTTTFTIRVVLKNLGDLSTSSAALPIPTF